MDDVFFYYIDNIYGLLAADDEDEDDEEKEDIKMKDKPIDPAVKNMRLAAPWYTYASKLKAIFDGDDSVKVKDIYKDDHYNGLYLLDVLVYDHGKFEILDKAITKEISFGATTLNVKVYDMENLRVDRDPYFEHIFRMFEDNPHVEDIKVIPDFIGAPHCFVIFKQEVIQFHNDDTSDINGNWSGLAQDIAKEVFDVGAGVHFCTSAQPKKEEE